MAKVDTLPEILKPLMDGTKLRTPYCPICGRTAPLNQHHIVKRSAGKMYRGGVELPKPTITLCGVGNAIKGPDGETYCHGLAHANRLHFRWAREMTKHGNFGTADRVIATAGGHWEYLIVDEPCKYSEALEMDGWKTVEPHGEF